MTFSPISSPRLREVEARESGKIVRFPSRAAWTIGLSGVAAAAAAVAIFALITGRPSQNPDVKGVAKLAQTSADIVWSKPAGQAGSIEWQVGSSIPAGTSIRPGIGHRADLTLPTAASSPWKDRLISRWNRHPKLA